MNMYNVSISNCFDVYLQTAFMITSIKIAELAEFNDDFSEIFLELDKVISLLEKAKEVTSQIKYEIGETKI